MKYEINYQYMNNYIIKKKKIKILIFFKEFVNLTYIKL